MRLRCIFIFSFFLPHREPLTSFHVVQVLKDEEELVQPTSFDERSHSTWSSNQHSHRGDDQSAFRSGGLLLAAHPLSKPFLFSLMGSIPHLRDWSHQHGHGHLGRLIQFLGWVLLEADEDVDSVLDKRLLLQSLRNLTSAPSCPLLLLALAFCSGGVTPMGTFPANCFPMNFDFLRWLLPSSQEAARRTAIFSKGAGAVEKRAHKTTTLTPTCKRIKDSEEMIHFSWTTRQVPLHQAQCGEHDGKKLHHIPASHPKRKGSRESCFVAFSNTTQQNNHGTQ